MGGLSIWHLIFAAVVILLLFGGRGKISGIMGDTAKGIKAFREGLKGEEETAKEEEPAPPAKPLPKPTAKPAARASAPRTTKAKTTAKPAAKPRAKTKA
ncbi:MAG: twin-arginine translocase TatA/TatE family subunit [Phenylobacterium sp.]|nr:MAG: twin-arginine translocase TatA/TatE family subunit [Phenylobacterium sp.]